MFKPLGAKQSNRYCQKLSRILFPPVSLSSVRQTQGADFSSSLFCAFFYPSPAAYLCTRNFYTFLLLICISRIPLRLLLFYCLDIADLYVLLCLNLKSSLLMKAYAETFTKLYFLSLYIYTGCPQKKYLDLVDPSDKNIA